MKAKRKYAKATDEIFLQRLQNGTLRVDLETGRVEGCFHRGRMGPWLEVMPIKGGRQKDRLFIRVCINGARKAISLPRLIWMAKTGELIPDGIEIDHEDHNRHNHHRENQRPREASENHRDNRDPWDDDF